MTVTLRVRSIVWFVTGAGLAVVVTLLFVSALRADAAPGDSDTTFVPINPGCRFADTRQAAQGPAIGSQQVRTFTAHGTNNACTIPNDAVGLLMNMTVDGQTAANSFLTVWGNGANPGTSALNPAAGQPPTPNAVTTDLTPAGQFNIYNDAGFVNVIIDINGYYTKTSLTELASRLTAAEAKVAANETGIATNTTGIAGLDAREPFAVTARDDQEFVAATVETVVSVTVTAPAAGHVTVNSTTNAIEPTAGEDVACSIRTAATPPFHDFEYLQAWKSPGGLGDRSQMGGTRVFDIAAGEIATYDLVCDHIGPAASFTTLGDSVLTAIFTPAP